MRAGAARATASSERSHGPVISPDAVRTNNPKAMSQTKARDLRVYRMERHSGNPKRRGTKTNYRGCPGSDSTQPGATCDRRPSNARHRGNLEARPHFIRRLRSV